MIAPNEFWLQLHRLAGALEGEGLTPEERAQNIVAQYGQMPAIARRAVLNDLTLVAVSIPDLYSLVAAESNGSSALDEHLRRCLDDAIAITAADKGNLQLIDPDGSLRIVIHRGFSEAFLNFFARVQGSECACGTALARGERTIIEDVATSPIFAGTEALDVMLAAEARACQSTPLIDGSGRVVGVLSTHFKAPRRPTTFALRKLDVLARRAAKALAPKRVG